MVSRAGFFLKIWECCETLFSLGSVERRDAYNILSLQLSVSACYDCNDMTDNTIRGVQDFEMRTKKEFWKQIKNGLASESILFRFFYLYHQ